MFWLIIKLKGSMNQNDGENSAPGGTLEQSIKERKERKVSTFGYKCIYCSYSKHDVYMMHYVTSSRLC